MVDELEYQFDDAGLPHPSIYRPLLDTFFATLSGHFPSIHRRRMEERLNTGTMSAFLLNCKLGHVSNGFLTNIIFKVSVP